MSYQERGGDDVVEKVVKVCHGVSISGAHGALSKAIEDGQFTHVLVRLMSYHMYMVVFPSGDEQ